LRRNGRGQGELAMASKDYDKAVQHLVKAMELDPDNAVR
jgi:Flp pilus assembly protein TadD